ncbi:MAG TPA: hypothetical protein VEJ23_07140 [Solirubrobacteraceae bacterium]|nr:hypothetical protein [Solirubrobacteraceae bacterium]
MSAVPAALLEQLAAARRRGEGFDRAWPDAVGMALEAADAADRQGWAEALNSLADAWRASFERRPPSRQEHALAVVASDPDRVPVPDRECARCGGEVPPDRPRRASYCSQDCRDLARLERARAPVAA